MSGLGPDSSGFTAFSSTFSAFGIRDKISRACWVFLLPPQLAACCLLFTATVLRKDAVLHSPVWCFPAVRLGISGSWFVSPALPSSDNEGSLVVLIWHSVASPGFTGRLRQENTLHWNPARRLEPNAIWAPPTPIPSVTPASTTLEIQLFSFSSLWFYAFIWHRWDTRSINMN